MSAFVVDKKTRPTVLDHLTAPTVSPETLRIRATYWRGVADRNERHGRAEQARRLRVNCDAMDRQAVELECSPVPSIVSPSRVQRTLRAPRVPNHRLGAKEFWTFYGQAVASIHARYGSAWKCAAPHGETVLVSLASSLRSYKGPRGGIIRYRRDHRIPGASYWPGGRLPEGLTLHAEPPRETSARPWRHDWEKKDKRPTYGAWLTAWAKANNLVRHGSVWLTPDEIAAIKVEPIAEAA